MTIPDVPTGARRKGGQGGGERGTGGVERTRYPGGGGGH